MAPSALEAVGQMVAFKSRATRQIAPRPPSAGKGPVPYCVGLVREEICGLDWLGKGGRERTVGVSGIKCPVCALVSLSPLFALFARIYASG